MTFLEPTKLSIEKWRELMGFHPFSFWQLYSGTYKNRDFNGCEPTFQFNWQYGARISRHDISVAIREAEDRIEDYIGYHLLPDWDEAERTNFDRAAFRETYNVDGRNVRFGRVSVETHWGHVLYGGVRTKTGIETAAVVRSDADGDGYKETCTVTVATSVEDADEIKVYFAGKAASDEYEIRPIEVTLDTDANTATITFKSWLIIDPDMWEDINPAAINADTDGNYETTVDVYRVYNDPSTQVTFIWEQDGLIDSCCTSTSCIACQLGTQTGCMHNRDDRLGIVVPAPAEWSASNQNFTKKRYNACRAPDQIKLYYLSGNRDFRLDRPRSEMESYWESTVAYYAAGLLQKSSCGCDSVSAFIQHWQEIREFSSRESGTYFQTQSQLTNPFGSSNGAKYAYERCNSRGRKLGR